MAQETQAGEEAPENLLGFEALKKHAELARKTFGPWNESTWSCTRRNASADRSIIVFCYTCRSGEKWIVRYWPGDGKTYEENPVTFDNKEEAKSAADSWLGELGMRILEQ